MATSPMEAARRRMPPIPHAIHFLSDEKIIVLIQGAYVLYRGWQILTAIGISLAAALGIAFYTFNLWWLELLAVAMVAAFSVNMLIQYFYYWHNLCILTNRRIIQIEWEWPLLLFRERHIETEYDTIREVDAEVKGLFHHLFNIGGVHIETPGSLPDIRIKSVDRPFAIEEKIYSLRDQFRQR